MKFSSIKLAAAVVFLMLTAHIALYAQETSFTEHLIDSFPGGYKIAVADLNADSKPDIIGLSTNPANLVWYENPSWQKYVITTETVENIDPAVADIKGDGRLNIVAVGSATRNNKWYENKGAQ